MGWGKPCHLAVPLALRYYLDTLTLPCHLAVPVSTRVEAHATRCAGVDATVAVVGGLPLTTLLEEDHAPLALHLGARYLISSYRISRHQISRHLGTG